MSEMYLILENYNESSHPESLFEEIAPALLRLRKLNGRPWERDEEHEYSLQHITKNKNRGCGCLKRPEIYYDTVSRSFYSFFSGTGESYNFKTYDQYLTRCNFLKKPLVAKKSKSREIVPDTTPDKK